MENYAKSLRMFSDWLKFLIQNVRFLLSFIAFYTETHSTGNDKKHTKRYI